MFTCKFWYVRRKPRMGLWLVYGMRLGFAALLALGLLVGTALAENQKVQINGKYLDNVDDILKETGNSNRVIPKNSLLITSWSSNNDMRWDINTVDTSGSSTTIKSMTESGRSLGTRNAGMHTAVSRGVDSRGRHLALTAMNNGDNGIQFRLFKVGAPTKTEKGKNRIIIKDEDVELSALSEWSSLSVPSKAVVTDVKSGLFRPSVFVGAKEVFVVTIIVGVANHDTDDEGYFRIGQQVKGSYSLADQNSNDLWAHYEVWGIPISMSYDGVEGYPFLIDSGDSKGLYCVARVDTGDLDHDGAPNEIAIVRSVYANGDRYQLLVQKLDSDMSLSPINTLKDYTDLGSAKDSDHLRWMDGVDVAVGDFDGDGKDEIVTAINDRDDASSYLTVQTFKWNGSDFDTTWTSMDDNNDYRLSNYNYDDNGITHGYGLMVRAGDINGDGKDEIVTLTARANDLDDDSSAKSWLNLTAWECSESSMKPSLMVNKYLKDADIYLPSNQHEDPHRYINSYFYRCFDMVAAPILGQVNTKATTSGAGSVADVAISWAASSGTDEWEYEDGKAGTAGTCQRVYVFASVLDSSGSFQGFTDPKEIWKLDGMGTVGLAAADFAIESMVLGDPSHLKTTALDEYLSVFYVPPYHVDTIKTEEVPWWNDNNGNYSTTAPTNLSYTGSSVTFSRTTSDAESKNHTHSVYDSNSFGWNVGGGSEGDNQGPMKRAEIFSDPSSIATGFSFSASGGYSASTLSGNTEQTSESSAISTTLSTTVSTNTYDLIQYNASDLHLWMYPVKLPVRAAMVGGDGTTEENVGDVYYIFSMLDNPSQKFNASNSSVVEDYAVTHEEGNLFSYPQSVGKITGYADANEFYDRELNMESDTPSSNTFSFSSTSSKSETDTTQTNHSGSGSFSGAVGVLSNLLKLNGGFTNTDTKIETDIQTATSSYSESETVNIVANASSMIPGRATIATNYTKYNAIGQLFKDSNGVLILGFAVDFDPTAWLWSTSNMDSVKSPYAQKADPALVLPGRYMLSNNTWTMSKSRESATRVRGLRVYEQVTDNNGSTQWSETDMTLMNDRKYKISVPLYNASLVDAGSVEVKFSWRGKDDETLSADIGTYTVNLGAWVDGDTSEGNKGTVEFEWTPSGFAEGNYYLFIDVDPDGKIDEIHEAWSEEFADDGKSGPDGNNSGYKPFAIVNKDTKYVVDASAQAVSLTDSAGVSESNFTLWFRDVANPDVPEYWMDEETFRNYAIAQPGTFMAEQHVVYNGSKDLTHVKFVLSAINPDGREGVLLQRNIPAIWRGEEWHLHFPVDPEMVKNTRIVADLFCAEGYFRGERPEVTTDDTPTSNTPTSNNGSGGCDMGPGAGVLTLLALAAVMATRGKQR